VISVSGAKLWGTITRVGKEVVAVKSYILVEECRLLGFYAVWLL
jgi:hypothetical protein